MAVWVGTHATHVRPTGQSGKFYDFQLLSKTLAVAGLDEPTDASGKKHDWRADLTAELGELQGENGSWVNRAERFFEGDPNLATALALIALANCDPVEVGAPAGTTE